MRKSYAALVVGAGIGGIRAALDLAETGQKVALIDSAPHLGGILAQLDHQFPSDHCGMCKMLPLAERDSSSQFCMRKGLFHKNIDLYLSTELDSLEGEPGKFQARLRKRSTFVDPTRCIGCGKCEEVCPVRVPSEFNAGLTLRGAAHLPVPHNIPNHYVVDLDNCIRCWQCHEACPTGAINFFFEQRRDFRILVAGTEEAEFGRLSDWLKDLNFPLEYAATGDEVLDRVTGSADENRISMLLLDMDTPGVDLERVVSRCLEYRPDLPVVLMGDAAQRESATELLRMGVHEFALKPFARKNFVPWLDKLYMRLVSDDIRNLDVVSVILATGFSCYDPANDPNGVADVLGYGHYPGVLTSVEFERMLSGTGPSGGKLVVPGTKRRPRRIAWLQCVGSRDLKTGADYCSSICCMISLKEAMLARRNLGSDVEMAIFYMDMRTFGKEFEAYKSKAEKSGVRLLNSRIHSVVSADPTVPDGELAVEYMDADGNMVSEHFDMMVLAVGARPPKGILRLAEAAGVELNPNGFLQTEEFGPSRTTRLGVFAAGSAGAPRDIAESVITSGAAAAGASRLINLYSPLKERTPDPEPEYRDVSRERARTFIALCHDCPVLESSLEMDALEARLHNVTSVVGVARVKRTCTGEGWARIRELTEELQPNRIVIGACMPYAYVPKLRELGRELRLNPALMDVVDIYTPLVGIDETSHDAVFNDVVSRISMAASKLERSDPSPLPPPQQVVREALVVGGGLAGMTAAMSIADHGYPVTLVERSENLGGNAMNLRYTLEGNDPQHHMQELIEQVQKHPNITVHVDARVVLSMGRAGRFMSVVSTDDGAVPVEHGVSILATGGHESRIYEYGYRVHKNVYSQLELEHKLSSGEIDTGSLDSVAMIQCWRSRTEDRNYCSRVCCASALKNLLHLKRKRPGLPVYIFYRDIMSYGFSEKYYTEARKLGAIFIRYEPGRTPQVSVEDGQIVLRAFEPVIQREIELRPDLVALSAGLEPNDVGDLAEMFGVELDQFGFFQEAESKWRPVDFLKQGVFTCGVARAPGNMSETIASAKAAAQRCMRILSEKRLTCGNVVAEVRHTLCSRCGLCIDVCPYGARRLDMDHDRIVVDELLCQGCGSCTAVCPNSASVMRGFRDEQIMAVIDSALMGGNRGNSAERNVTDTPEPEEV